MKKQMRVFLTLINCHQLRFTNERVDELHHGKQHEARRSEGGRHHSLIRTRARQLASFDEHDQRIISNHSQQNDNE